MPSAYFNKTSGKQLFSEYLKGEGYPHVISLLKSSEAEISRISLLVLSKKGAYVLNEKADDCRLLSSAIEEWSQGFASLDMENRASFHLDKDLLLQWQKLYPSTAPIHSGLIQSLSLAYFQVPLYLLVESGPQASFVKKDTWLSSLALLQGMVERMNLQEKDMEREFLTSLATYFNQQQSLSAILKKVLQKIAEVTPIELGEIWLVHVDKKSIRQVATYAGRPDLSRFYQFHKGVLSFSYGEGLPGMVWKLGDWIKWQGKELDQKAVRKEAVRFSGIRSVLGVPIMVEEVVIGVICLGSTHESIAEDKRLKFLIKLIPQLAAQIQRKSIEQELDNFFQLSADAIVVVGLDGYFKKINPAFCKILGYTEKELKSRPLRDLIYEEDRKVTQEGLQRLMREKVTLSFENRYLAKNGSLIWMSWTATPSPNDDLVFGVGKDISRWKKTELKIKEANERYKLVTQATNDAIWDWDVAKRTLAWGKGYKSLFGYESQEFPDLKNWMEKVHPEDFPLVKESLKMMINDPSQNFWQLEYRYQKADGSYVFINDKGYLLRNAEGQPVRMVGAMQDLTERKKHEEYLEKLNQSLKEKTEELTRSNQDLEHFAYVASHDLQEPLRMVTGFLGQIELKYGDRLDEKGKKYISFASDGAKRMRSMIKGLLEYSRAGRMLEKMDLFSVEEIVHEVQHLLNRLIAEKKAQISHSSLPSLIGNPSAIRQVFLNLISNALNYMEEGKSPKIQIECIKKNNHFIFSVADNGIGISEDAQDKVFTIFHRLHPQEKYAGTGLGLAISKKIVENHGGKIWLRSIPGQGSTFYFSLPIVDK